MDSEDEASSCSGEGEKAAKSAKVAKEPKDPLDLFTSTTGKSAGEEDAEPGDRPSPVPVQLSEVTTLAQMLRLVPQLRRRLGTMPAAELVEVIVAASRVRFYDGELFEDLLPELRSRLRKRGTSFSVREMVDCATALQELNAYDAATLSGIAKALRSRINELDLAQRRRLLAAFKSADHKSDSDFVSLLVQREKQEAETLQAQRQAADYLVSRSPGQLRPCRF